MNIQIPKCKICDQGELRLTNVYRLSRPVAVIGYIFLIPSVLVFIFSILAMVTMPSAIDQAQEDKKNTTRTELQVMGIPNPIIAKVLSGESLSTPEKNRLTPKQKSKIAIVQPQFTVQNEVKGVAIFASGSIFFMLILGSLIWGLIGFLLTMRKKVLKCDNCMATVNAG